jgi:hypothetical protein
MTEYIYLVQPREFIKTKENIYKIGKTKQENLKRISGYDNGTILICQFKCDDCDKLEKKLIKLFKEKFELQKDIGNEYFKGNCDDMRDVIFNYIRNGWTENIIEVEEDNNKEEDEEEGGSKEEDDYRLDEIKVIFPCYKDDECFGGKKKLVKICIEENENINSRIGGGKIRKGTYLSVHYINYKIPYMKYINISTKGESNYWNKLLNKKIIVKNEIYDMNNKQFINKQIKYKNKITIDVETISDIIKKFKIYKDTCCNIEYIVNNIILNNCILNDEIYCNYFDFSYENIDCIDTTIYIDFHTCDIVDGKLQSVKGEQVINIMKLANITFDYAFLRKYTPYMIDVNENGYYIYNRDYQIIDINDVKYSIENWKSNCIYLYNDGTNPIRSCHTEKKFKKLFKDMMINYNNITSNKTCMNMNEKTQMILNLI